MKSTLAQVDELHEQRVAKFEAFVENKINAWSPHADTYDAEDRLFALENTVDQLLDSNAAKTDDGRAPASNNDVSCQAIATTFKVLEDRIVGDVANLKDRLADIDERIGKSLDQRMLKLLEVSITPMAETVAAKTGGCTC